MANTYRPVTEGAGQEIVARLNALLSMVQSGTTVTVNSADYTDKSLLTETAGRDIAAKLASLMTAFKTYVAPASKKVEHTLTIGTSKFDGSSDITVSNATQSAAGLLSATDKTKLDGIATGAEVNQNAFAKITVGSTTIEADAKQDTLTLVAGDNVTLTPDVSGDKITIVAKDTTYAAATQSAAGLLSASDKTKLDGISVKKVTLNGTENAEPSIYAPTSAGTDGKVLVSNGSGAPTWKTVGSATVDKPSITIEGVIGQTTTVNVARVGSGAITVSTSNSNIATATVSGTTITITAKGSGTATITVNVASTSTYSAATCAISVTADLLSSTLEDNTWEKIRACSDKGMASSVWSIGATKSVQINGTVGTLSINQTAWVYIIGFNHNESYEGSNKIHFQGFKTAQSGGKDIALVDSGYGSGYTDGSKYFNQNHWGNYNYGGWKASDIRYDILGSTDQAPQNYGSAKASGVVGYDASDTCATNPVAGTLMAALPSDLRAVMKPITKYSDNVAGATNVADNISASVDYLPLLAEFEVHGARTYANQYEQNYQAQYAYYKNGNSKIKYQHTADTSAAYWWVRSAYYTNSNLFCFVITSGSANGNGAYRSWALAPAFAV